MRILLITGKSREGYNIAPSLGLYQLRHFLIQRDVDCDLLDRELYPEDDALARAQAGDYDLIGFSVSHDNMAEELDLLWRFRQAVDGQDCLFIAGGQEAALNTQQWLQLGIDLIFLGFAEKSLLQFCRRVADRHDGSGLADTLPDLTLGVPGVAYLGGGDELVNIPSALLTQEVFEELFYEQILSIDIPFEEYWKKLRRDSADISLGASDFIIENVRLYTSSHCPRRCGFCSSQSFLPESAGSAAVSIIMLRAEQIVSLIRTYVDRDGARSFLFSDDDFPVGNKVGLERLRKVCELIIADKGAGRLPADLRFSCQARVLDFVRRNQGGERGIHGDLLRLMAEAGFMSIGLGVETFSDRLFKVPSVNKGGITLDTCRLLLDFMLDIGIVPQTNLILGIPEYTADELAATMEIAVDYLINGTDIAVTQHLLAIPGAPMFASGAYQSISYDWTNPVTGETAAIADYFPPNDPKVAAVIDGLKVAAAEELDGVVKQQGWEGKIVHKRVVGMTTLIAVARLLGRTDLVDKFCHVLDGVLDHDVEDGPGPERTQPSDAATIAAAE
jgi:radical SAM superfamily enzyme YgiQ (UPF0313 family)